MGFAADVIRVARKEEGYQETGRNHTKYPPAVPSLEWAQNQPWCATFVAWVFLMADVRGLAPVTASCEVGANWFKRQGRFGQTPRVGSIVYYGPRGSVHVEIVTEVAANRIRTIGGNTSGSLDGQYFNGDGVYEKWVERDSPRIHGYGYPDYEPETPSDIKVPKFTKELRYGSKGPQVTGWQNQMSKRGWRIAVDGFYGSESEAVARSFQLEKGLEVDGIVGPDTWRASWTLPVTP